MLYVAEKELPFEQFMAHYINTGEFLECRCKAKIHEVLLKNHYRHIVVIVDPKQDLDSGLRLGVKIKNKLIVGDPSMTLIGKYIYFSFVWNTIIIHEIADSLDAFGILPEDVVIEGIDDGDIEEYPLKEVPTVSWFAGFASYPLVIRLLGAFKGRKGKILSMLHRQRVRKHTKQLDDHEIHISAWKSITQYVWKQRFPLLFAFLPYISSCWLKLSEVYNITIYSVNVFTMTTKAPFNPDFVENDANVLPNSGFFDKEQIDGRGLPKLGKNYEVTLAMLQIHKDGLEKEYKHLFTQEHMWTVEQLSDSMKEVAKLFSIDPDNFTVSDAYMLMPSFRSTGYDAQVGMIFWDGSYKEYFRPVIKKNEDGSYNVAIQDATEGVYLALREKQTDLWHACMECIHTYLRHCTNSFLPNSFGSDSYYDHLSSVTKYFDKYPTDVKKAHAEAAFNPDCAAEALGVDSLSTIQKRDVFRFVPQYINYVPTYEDFKLSLSAFLQHDEAKNEYVLSYILNDHYENKNLKRNNKIRKEIGDTILEIKWSSWEDTVRKAYNVFRSYAHQFPGDSHNAVEKNETALRNHLDHKFVGHSYMEIQHHVSDLLAQYQKEGITDDEKQQLRIEAQKVIHMESSNAYDPQYYLCISVLFDLDETMQKHFAIKSIQSGLIGKICRNERGMSLSDVWAKKGIELPQRKDHVIHSNYSNEDVQTIAKGFAISADELSLAIRDVYLLRQLRDEHFVKSNHIRNHNTYGEWVTERIWSLMNSADQEYVMNLEIALWRELVPADAGTEEQQKERKLFNHSQFDKKVAYDNLVILCERFGMSLDAIVASHRDAYQNRGGGSFDVASNLQKMVMEKVADAGSEYEKKFTSFVWDVATVDTDLEKKQVDHRWLNHTYPKQPLFFFEDGDKFIVTDQPEKYAELQFTATVNMTNYQDYWSRWYVSGNSQHYEKDSKLRTTNSYSAWKDTWKKEYLGAFMKAMPEAYQNDANHGVLSLSRVIW